MGFLSYLAILCITCWTTTKLFSIMDEPFYSSINNVLFHLAQCPQGSSMLRHVSEFPSFQRLNNIPLYVFLYVRWFWVSFSSNIAGFPVPSTCPCRSWWLPVGEALGFRQTFPLACVTRQLGGGPENERLWLNTCCLLSGVSGAGSGPGARQGS